MARAKRIAARDWQEFSLYIRYGVADGHCMCHGDCRGHQTPGGPIRCSAVEGKDSPWSLEPVILTVVARCQCPPRCENEAHVLALCQGCRSLLPVPVTQEVATPPERPETPGQLALFG